MEICKRFQRQIAQVAYVVNFQLIMSGTSTGLMSQMFALSNTSSAIPCGQRQYMFHFVYILKFNYLTLYKVHIYAGTKGKLVYVFVSVREIIDMLKLMDYLPI